MRTLLVPILICVLAVAVGTALVVWLRQRGRPGASRGDLERLLTTHGAARCVESARLLRRLTERSDSAAIAQAWEAIELPLLQAVPDCPPDYKVELINALDGCARACRVVEVSRRIMTMRNALLA